MKDMTFLFLTLTGKEGITGQLLLSAQQASEDPSEAPSARLCMCQGSHHIESTQTLMALFCQVLPAQLPPNSLSQLASPLSCVCPAVLQPVFIQLLEPWEELTGFALLLCVGPTTQQQARRKWNKETEVPGVTAIQKLWIRVVTCAFCILIAQRKQAKGQVFWSFSAALLLGNFCLRSQRRSHRSRGSSKSEVSG